VTEIFAHRGLHTGAPENSVASFAEARLAGCDGVELDVRRTSDGALVVQHDEVVPGLGPVGSLSCRELPSSLATLEEALTACEGLTVNAEIKNWPSEAHYDPSGALAHQVVAALDELGWLEDVIVSSFDLATCEAARAADASVRVGWILAASADAPADVERARERDLDAVHPHHSLVTGALVARAHGVGLAVSAWTPNDRTEMARLFALDVDVLISDDPLLALRERANLTAAR
jgi:glycerophosphoryl diester phosphodiesterase